jgi:cell division protein FtsB
MNWAAWPNTQAAAHSKCCNSGRFWNGRAADSRPLRSEGEPIKSLIVIIILLIIHLQYRLWYGDGGIREIHAHQQRLDELKEQVEEKKARNEALYAEVLDLRKGQAAIEERARYELGMIREDETFFQVLE